MSFTTGTRVGHYEVVAAAGAGGMGEVYQARDVRLDRDVALKTIKGPFTERFEREARAISALNHPNICTLYDVGEHDGSGYLVMEFIDGKEIAGPMPVEQAIAYGIQICEALHAAHRKGIVHRDLKPANILVTKQGVKLLDFGLAKLAATGPAVSSSAVAQDATVAALTGTHTVVGTPQYMAPEQIEGREVDARTDIFAFGCVLYELLTGKRAFDGPTPSTVMAAVLATNPRPLDQLVPLTPPALERIVSRCLAKDPEDRWQSARDVAAELLWISQGGSQAGLPVVVSGRRRVREKLAWAGCAAAVVVAGAFAVLWMMRAPEPPPLVRFALVLPASVQNPSPPALSPDGRYIAFTATANGVKQVYVRPMDAIDARPLPGTDGAYRPFWSPDSRFIGFVAGGKLKRVDTAGGPPQVICDAGEGDGSWSPTGVILFDGTITDPLRQVSASGGVPKPVVLDTDKPSGTPGAGWPEFLPDGTHFLYSVVQTGGELTLKVGQLDSTTSTTLMKTTTRVSYAAPGYLLFVRDRTLVAQRFNPDTLKVEGDAVPLGEGLGTDNVGLASFSVSRTGVLAYRGGELGGARLMWMDRTGKETPLLGDLADYHDTWFSPDRTRVVYDVANDVWIRDLQRGVSSRFTFGPNVSVDPIWSPDGRRIVYTSRQNSAGDLYVRDASGTKDAEPLLVNADEKYVSDWSKDGRYLLYTARGGTNRGWDLWLLPMNPDGGHAEPVPLVRTEFNELWATFSPDGKYIAYQSNESGRSEVYVQEFPDPRNKWRVSTSGGGEAYWRPDGKELFYRSGAHIMSVPLEERATLTIGTPSVLFDAPFPAANARGFYRPWFDGQRFLVLSRPSGQADQPATVVLNWTAALKR